MDRPEVIAERLPRANSSPSRSEEERHPFEVPGFSDIVAFVEQTTSRIWDDKNPGLIAEWYTPTTVVHTSYGDVFGKDAVIESALLKMAAFPDIKDHVEETIWTRSGSDYLTSMRWTWTGRNTGWSVWGPPTGRRVRTRGIANCVVRDGRYVEEWVAYDELTTLRQLGMPVETELARLTAADPASAPGGIPPAGWTDTDRRLGQEEPAPVMRGAYDEVEHLVRAAWHEVWNRRMLGALDRCYAPEARYHGPNGQELYGVAGVRHDVLARLAMLPDARMHVDEVYYTVVEGDEVHVAVRWTLVGTHSGPSRYGPPTGRRVQILGITHQRIRTGLVHEDWSVYSELDLLRQITLPRTTPDATSPAPPS